MHFTESKECLVNPKSFWKQLKECYLLSLIFGLIVYFIRTCMSWCPFENLKPVSKVFFNMSFILYLFSLLLIMCIASYTCSLHRKRKSIFKSFARRLVPCGLQLIPLGYTTITSGLFSLLLCQPIHPSKQVLFIDGTI